MNGIENVPAFVAPLGISESSLENPPRAIFGLWLWHRSHCDTGACLPEGCAAGRNLTGGKTDECLSTPTSNGLTPPATAVGLWREVQLRRISLFDRGRTSKSRDQRDRRRVRGRIGRRRSGDRRGFGQTDMGERRAARPTKNGAEIKSPEVVLNVFVSASSSL
jgi:hypothetical protein